MVKRKLTLIGIFVVISLAILIWGIHYLNGLNILKSKQTFYVLYERVGGLVETSPVYMNGYQIGQVRDLYFADTRSGHLTAKLSIEAGLKLPKSTQAEIYAVDLTGTKGIRIIPGKSEKYHESGDTLISGYNKDFAKRLLTQLDPLKIKIEKLLQSVDTLVNKTSDMVDRENKQNVAITLKNMAQLSKNLNSLIDTNKKSMSQTFKQIDTFSNSLEKNAAALDTTLQNLKAVSDSLKHAKLKSTLLAINSITRSIKQQKGTMGSLVYNDTLYQNLEKATRELEKLLGDIQKNPGKYVHFSLFGK